MRTIPLVLFLAACTSSDALEAPLVHVDPAEPDTTSTLRAVLDAEPREGEVVYEWRRGADPNPALTGDTVAPELTEAGESWTLVARVRIDDVVGDPTSSTVTIAPSPVEGTIQVVPAAPTSSDTLSCQTLLTDPDDDTIQLDFAWSVNGEIVGSGPTLAPSVFVRGDSVACEVTADDGVLQEQHFESAAVTIGESLPSIVTIGFDPPAPTREDTLGAVVTTADADGDDVTLAYAWFADGTLVGSESTLDLAAIPRGTRIELEVTPTGTGVGSPAVAAVTVENSPPTLGTADFSPARFDTSDTVGVDAEVLDADGDPITLTYAWRVEGTPAGDTDTLAPGNPRGTRIRVTITASDGHGGVSEPLDINGIIADAPGRLDHIEISDPQYDGVEAHCEGFGFTDPDGDTVTYDLTWTVDGGTPIPASHLLDPQFFAKGQTLRCSITPNSNGTSGLTVDSAVITVQNSLPTASVTLSSPIAAVDEAGLLCFVGDLADIDGDTVGTSFAWFEDGVDLGVTGDRLDPSLTDVGHDYVCRVYADDGDDVVALDSPPTTIYADHQPLGRDGAGTYIQSHVASDTGGGTVLVADVDLDGDDDVIIAPDYYDPAAYVPDRAYVAIDASYATWPVALHNHVGVAAVGDVNADGTPDVAIGDWSPPAGNSGQFYLFSLGVSGSQTGATAFTTVRGRPDSFVGSSIAAAGDLDGDGLPDIVVGGSIASPPVFFVLHGDAAMPASVNLGTAAAAQISAGTSTASFGSRVVGMGDGDGDGFDDVVFTCPIGPSATPDVGRIFVFRGPLSGSLVPADADALVTASEESLFGSSIAPLDADGDGDRDLAVGGGSYYVDGSGFVAMIPGDLAGSFELADLDPPMVIEGPADQVAGQSVAAGDLDGDTLDDLVWALPYDSFSDTRDGRVVVFDGPFVGSRTTDDGVTFHGTGHDTGDLLGFHPVLGDFAGDGTPDDLAVGAIDGVYIYWGL